MGKGVALVYLVAGLSSRFGGKIKPLANIGPNGKTFIECSLGQALLAGFNKIVFVVGKHTESAFKKKFKNNYSGVPIKYVLQEFDSSTRNNPWGTVDALCSARKELDRPFVVCNGDDLYGVNSFQLLFNHLNNSAEEATIGHRLIDTLPANGVVKRAVFNVDKEYVLSIGEVFSVSKLDINNHNPNDLSCMSIFGLHNKTLIYLQNLLDEFKKAHTNDRTIEFPLHNALSNLIEQKTIKMKMYLSQDSWIGLTNIGDEEIVRKFVLTHK